MSLLPEGNGHQNEFTADNQYFIGTDEDFAPYGATAFEIADGVIRALYVVRNPDKLRHLAR